MKNTILKLIDRATNKKTVVYDIKGTAIAVGEMEPGKFYCWNLNTLGSEQNIQSWTSYIAKNADVVKPVEPVEPPKAVKAPKAKAKAKPKAGKE